MGPSLSEIEAMRIAASMREAIDDSQRRDIEKVMRPTGKGERRKRRELKPKGKKKHGW
jgi:hypothetical protein